MPFGLDRHGNVYRIPVVDAVLVEESPPAAARSLASSLSLCSNGPVALQLVSTGSSGVQVRLRVGTGEPAQPESPADFFVDLGAEALCLNTLTRLSDSFGSNCDR